MVNIHLRHIEKADLPEYTYWKQPIHKYHGFNGPYFKKQTKAEIDLKIQALSKALDEGISVPIPGKKIISNQQNDLLGEVNWYWKSAETNWLEIGLVIFDESNWSKGIGYQALTLWIKEIFEEKKDLVRIGLSTWSGNKGMIRLAEKLGMIKEAQYRRARIVNGRYFDSISYGILKEDWAARQK
ncbi:MAG: GNAT family protein [Bacteroidota bacterium]